MLPAIVLEEIYLAHAFPPIPPAILSTISLFVEVIILSLALGFSAWLSSNYPDLSNKKSVGFKDIWLQGFLTAIIFALIYFSITFNSDIHFNFNELSVSLQERLTQALVSFLIVFPCALLASHLTLRFRIKRAKLQGSKAFVFVTIFFVVVGVLLDTTFFIGEYENVKSKTAYEKRIAKVDNRRLVYESPFFLFTKPKDWDFESGYIEQNLEKIEKTKIIRVTSTEEPPTFITKSGAWLSVAWTKNNASWANYYKSKIATANEEDDSQKITIKKRKFVGYPALEYKEDDNYREVETIVQGYKYTISLDTSYVIETKIADKELEQFIETFKKR